MIRVLFVCLGNICRSPMAEAVFRQQVKDANLDSKIKIDSAGTAGWHKGKPPHEGTTGKLDEQGISYEGMTARQVEQKDFADFDVIITMDEDNLATLQAAFSIHEASTTVCKLMDFVENPKEENVPDPYYTGDFDYTYELIEEACSSLQTFLQNKYHI